MPFYQTKKSLTKSRCIVNMYTHLFTYTCTYMCVRVNLLTLVQFTCAKKDNGYKNINKINMNKVFCGNNTEY